MEKVKNAAVNDQMFRRIFAVVYFGELSFCIDYIKLLSIRRYRVEYAKKMGVTLAFIYLLMCALLEFNLLSCDIAGGRQFKIATNDIIMVHKIAAQCGDKIRLQKVMHLYARNYGVKVLENGKLALF